MKLQRTIAITKLLASIASGIGKCVEGSKADDVYKTNETPSI